MTLSTPFLQRTEMFANLIKRYGTRRSSTRYLQGVSHFKKTLPQNITLLSFE